MNVYCKSCKKEMEIAEDLGSEIHVFDCGCTDIAALRAEVDGLREALTTLNQIFDFDTPLSDDEASAFGIVDRTSVDKAFEKAAAVRQV
jgi:hypothetical protein